MVKKARCDGSEDAEFLRGVTKKRGEELLLADMTAPRWAVMSAVTVPLTDGQFAALCDFTFNVGVANFRKSALLKAVNENRFDDVYTQLMRWTWAGGKQIPGLRNRREREYALFFDGIPQLKAAPPAGEDVRPVDIRTGEPIEKGLQL
ncbi:lysozyme [Bradyrhizobium sp. CCGB12]|uniref:lysozyme n=1 Tax=Bradyrhizobium sp. CCGB12 TaxID=2949632 RepID=UPI0020B2F613|nr:lysozyme [Bradyrhizobium sp. CCGB12]MCP3395301.1 lysozyme [Bradyrhizobium sp. CCGB12]